MDATTKLASMTTVDTILSFSNALARFSLCFLLHRRFHVFALQKSTCDDKNK
jgi:hypothetical protein